MINLEFIDAVCLEGRDPENPDNVHILMGENTIVFSGGEADRARAFFRSGEAAGRVFDVEGLGRVIVPGPSRGGF